MSALEWQTLLQLGPLAVVLLYIVMRLERAMGAIALGVERTNQILLLLLRRAHVGEEQALKLVDCPVESSMGVPPVKTGE